jgi:hypothetical protein
MQYEAGYREQQIQLETSNVVYQGVSGECERGTRERVRYFNWNFTTALPK